MNTNQNNQNNQNNQMNSNNKNNQKNVIDAEEQPFPNSKEDVYFSNLNLQFFPRNTYCNYRKYENKNPALNNYNVDLEGPVNRLERDSDPYTKIRTPPPNGELYGGPQTNRAWGSIHVIPTATNYINNNLHSANPPPGATIQYVSNDRFGNNYSPMPGIQWYNPTSPHLKNKFNIKGPYF